MNKEIHLAEGWRLSWGVRLLPLWPVLGMAVLVFACNENPAEVIIDVDVPPCDSTCPPQLPPDTVTVTLTDTLVVTVADTTRIYCWVTDDNANTGNPEYTCDDGTVGPRN